MLAEPSTRQALHRLGQRVERRPPLPANLPQAAGQARRRVLADLETYLRRFEAQAQAQEMRVWWAEDYQQADRLVVERIRASGQTKALRNHSPLFDEIALDRAAAVNGIELIPIHPGDHYLKLTGAAPLHPIWPSAHLGLRELAAAMARAWRIPPSFDPDLLAGAARLQLRPLLLAAQVAVMGVQFAVAADGTLVCLDNDGHNAHLMALARHLICLVGIEQVVADVADLELLIRAFSLGAWGQPQAHYVGVIAGPPSTTDGPRRVDVILLDNGRRRALAAGLVEALGCIGCGACHAICPVYHQVGAAAYGRHARSGPIGAVLNPVLWPEPRTQSQPYLSSGCRACAGVCPVGIDLPNLLAQQRRRLADRSDFRERLLFGLWQRLLPYPRLFTLALRLARWWIWRS
ncbi:MAG: LUD domain-containing protein [Anaerolineae bacterium]|nr:LUD domain-containing protein [Anaerolineae bacterium]